MLSIGVVLAALAVIAVCLEAPLVAAAFGAVAIKAFVVS